MAPAENGLSLGERVPWYLSVEIDGLFTNSIRENDLEGPYGQLVAEAIADLSLAPEPVPRDHVLRGSGVVLSVREHRELNVALMLLAVNTGMVFPHWDDIRISASLSVYSQGELRATFTNTGRLTYIQSVLLLLPWWGRSELEQVRRKCIGSLTTALMTRRTLGHLKRTFSDDRGRWVVVRGTVDSLVARR